LGVAGNIYYPAMLFVDLVGAEEAARFM